MSAPTSRDPLVVNTVGGVCWKRQHVDGDGRGLYALAGVAACPAYVLASFGELAERGIVEVADALPMPVGPVPQSLSATRLTEIRNRRLDEVTPGPWLVADGEDGRPVVYVELPAGGVRVLFGGASSEADVQFVASARRSVPELLADNERLRARVAELEAERHSTNEALDEVVRELRARRVTDPEPEGEHYVHVHHSYRLGHDLPETGGPQ